jgi:hypothetical protein
MVLARYAGRVATGARCPGEMEIEMADTLNELRTLANQVLDELPGPEVISLDGEDSSAALAEMVLRLLGETGAARLVLLNEQDQADLAAVLGDAHAYRWPEDRDKEELWDADRDGIVQVERLEKSLGVRREG